MSETQNAFARNIKALREDRDITQTELASSLGLRPQTVSNWEKNSPRPRSPEVIRRLCDYFGVTEAELFGYSDGYYQKRLAGLRKQTPTPDPTPEDDEHPVPLRILERYPEGFVMTVPDGSMLPEIPEGASAYIAATDVVNGNIACISVAGIPLLRRITIYDDVYVLDPLAPDRAHRRQLIDRKDPEAPEVEILGRVVWFEKEL